MIDVSARSHQHGSVILDNALLFSAANFFVRQRDQALVRNVNLIGLSALTDALVMHQRLTVDRQGWDYFKAAVPPAWLPSIEPMVDVLDFNFPPQNAVAAAVATSANSVLLAYALTSVERIIQTEQGRDLIVTYFSYTGSDLGRHNEEQELVSVLQDGLAFDIPDMHLHLRRYEHVSALQSLVRVCQYQYVASELGQAYVPHDFRGNLINILAKDRTQPAYRLVWEQLLSVMSQAIRKETGETLAWTRPADDGSFALWERLEMPTFLAMALERTNSADDLFHHVLEIRNKAREVRELLEQFTAIDDRLAGARIANEVRRLAHELGNSAPAKPASIFSVSVGLPLMLGLGINLPSLKPKQATSFVRDIYDNHAVPLSLVSDIQRVFGAMPQAMTLQSLRAIAPGENVLDYFLENARSRADGLTLSDLAG